MATNVKLLRQAAVTKMVDRLKSEARDPDTRQPSTRELNWYDIEEALTELYTAGFFDSIRSMLKDTDDMG